ncbi:unnamed protein product, partial [Ectocarpus sp. 13 AM-2016]
RTRGSLSDGGEPRRAGPGCAGGACDPRAWACGSCGTSPVGRPPPGGAADGGSRYARWKAARLRCGSPPSAAGKTRHRRCRLAGAVPAGSPMPMSLLLSYLRQRLLYLSSVAAAVGRRRAAVGRPRGRCVCRRLGASRSRTSRSLPLPRPPLREEAC